MTKHKQTAKNMKSKQKQQDKTTQNQKHTHTQKWGTKSNNNKQ